MQHESGPPRWLWFQAVICATAFLLGVLHAGVVRTASEPWIGIFAAFQFIVLPPVTSLIGGRLGIKRNALQIAAFLMPIVWVFSYGGASAGRQQMMAGVACPAFLPALLVQLLIASKFPPPKGTRHGVCEGCGYDLRGLDQARCPESGTSFQAPGFQAGDVTRGRGIP